MKKIKLGPFGMIAIGMLIVVIGAFIKITKITNEDATHTILFIVGFIIEFIGVCYFLKSFNKMRKRNNEMEKRE